MNVEDHVTGGMTDFGVRVRGGVIQKPHWSIVQIDQWRPLVDTRFPHHVQRDGFGCRSRNWSHLHQCQEAVPIRALLLELGNPQPATPIQVDNPTVDGFDNDTIRLKRSKVIDMRFYWICDRTRQGQFLIYWQPGITNLGDYHTKHHSTAHHQLMRPVYLHTTEHLVHCVIAHIM